MTYEGMAVPFEVVPFKDMNKTQVKQYFNWYITTIEERIENLQRYINTNGADVVLDGTPESLIPLWEWFEKRIEVREKTEKELELATRGKPTWVKDIIMQDRREITPDTFLLGYDISAYFGEVIVKNNHGIKWGVWTKPKRLHGVNSPRLLGFAYDMSVYSHGKIEVCISKSIDEKDSMRLYSLYQKCVDMIYKG